MASARPETREVGTAIGCGAVLASAVTPPTTCGRDAARLCGTTRNEALESGETEPSESVTPPLPNGASAEASAPTSWKRASGCFSRVFIDHRGEPGGTSARSASDRRRRVGDDRREDGGALA